MTNNIVIINTVIIIIRYNLPQNTRGYQLKTSLSLLSFQKLLRNSSKNHPDTCFNHIFSHNRT